jgi:periplasmic protein TonB
MTSLFTNHPDHVRLQRQGWIYSMVFHAIMGSGALALVSGLHMSLEPDPFTWSVAIVEAPHTQPKVDTLPEAKPTPPPPRVAETHPAPAQPIIEAPKRVVQPVRAVPQIVQRELTTVNQTASVVTQTVQPDETISTVAPTVEREAVVQESQIITTQSAVTQTAKPVMTEPLETAAQHASVEPVGEPTVRSQQPAVEQTIIQTAPVKADYGWLVKALLGRLDQLKNYPHMARINHWEGKVVLRAVIKDDGQVLMIDVHESSGRLILDNDAIETLRRASPLKLDHPLGKPQVAILMPISYALR